MGPRCISEKTMRRFNVYTYSKMEEVFKKRQNRD
jgi:hypothetical protein